jgi:hypothetical protein
MKAKLHKKYQSGGDIPYNKDLFTSRKKKTVSTNSDGTIRTVVKYRDDGATKIKQRRTVKGYLQGNPKPTGKIEPFKCGGKKAKGKRK